MENKKAQGLSLNMVVIGAIALIVLVVILVIFLTNMRPMSKLPKTASTCSQFTTVNPSYTCSPNKWTKSCPSGYDNYDKYIADATLHGGESCCCKVKK